MWDLIVLIPDHCLSIYLAQNSSYYKGLHCTNEAGIKYLYQGLSSYMGNNELAKVISQRQTNHGIK